MPLDRHPSLAYSSLYLCPIFIGGEWRRISGLATSPVYNPSTRRSDCRSADVRRRCGKRRGRAAADAFPAWRDTPPVERARVFFRYRQLVEENFDRICQMVSREHGKTLAEARGSAYRGIENIEYACGVPTLLMGDTLENLARGVDCETMHQPLGVCVGITPFNFPAMVPMWMFPLALACGNTFVLKPSEKVPLTAIYLLSCSKKPACPKACSTSSTADASASMHCSPIRKCARFRFVGSSPIAKHIYETGTRHGKRVQANGGAKNYIVVMPDADVPRDGRELSRRAAFGCAGERCMAGSTALTVGRGSGSLVALASRGRARDQGRTDRCAAHSPTWGPVITAPASRPRRQSHRERRKGRRENHLPTAAASQSPTRRTDFSLAPRLSTGAERNDSRARGSFRPGAERDAHG